MTKNLDDTYLHAAIMRADNFILPIPGKTYIGKGKHRAKREQQFIARLTRAYGYQK